jgi:PAS domain S-box-containing protein
MNATASVSLSRPIPASGRGNSPDLVAEESELRYRRLFETAQDGILILDADTGKVIDVNPFLLNLLDYPFEGVIGLQLWQLGLFEDIAANQAAFLKLQEKEYIRYENLPLRTKAGKQIRVEFVSNVYFVGSNKVIQCNIRDISERSKEMADCRENIATLELSAKTKDHVLAMLSHELRTPLAAISYATEFLDAGRKWKCPSPERRSTAAASRSVGSGPHSPQCSGSDAND